MKSSASEMLVHRESMRTEETNICAERDVIWTDDLALGGLYTIDKVTFKMEAVLTPFQLFQYGLFRIRSIVKWRDNIIIVPLEINRKWVIYNKVSKEVQYKDVVKEKRKIYTAGLYIIDDYSIAIPASVQDPILLINLERMECVRTVEEWGKNIGLQSNRIFGIWHGEVVKGSVYFPLCESRYVVKVTIDKIEGCELEIPCGIRSISFCMDKIWALPMEGSHIYELDQNGKKIAAIELADNGASVCAADFVRIVAASRFVFLLPFQKEEIYVYDKERKYSTYIGDKEAKLKNTFTALYPTTAYWGYYVDGNKIWFMPSEYKFLMVDLDTLEWEQKDIFLPLFVMGEELSYWYEWIQFLRGNIGREKQDARMLEMYLEMLKNADTGSLFGTDRKGDGERIWEKICR